MFEELDGPAIRALAVRSQNLSNNAKASHRMGDQNYLQLFRASEGTLSQSRLYLQSLAPIPVSRRVG
jgi:hypothetical protein